MIALCLTAVAAWASEGDELWQHAYGGSAQDWGYDMAPTADGGMVLAGYTRSFGASGKDVYVVKVDAAGNQQWDAPLGTAANDVARAVIQTADGGYLVAGEQDIGSTYTKQGLLIKLDSAGQEQWQHTYGGSEEDDFFDVVECAAGGYALAGVTASSGPGGHVAWLVRTDSLGTVQWTVAAPLEGHGADYLTALVETTDGQFVVAGYSGDGNTFPSYDAQVAAFSSTGSLLWRRTFDASGYDRAYDITSAPRGGFVLAGTSAGAMTIWRTDAAGYQIWTQQFSTVTADYGYAVIPTSDGGFLVGGSTYNYDMGDYQMYVGKTDGDGHALWEQLYGGAGRDNCEAIVETPAGDYALAGTTGPIDPPLLDDLEIIVIEGPNSLAPVGESPPVASLQESLAAYPNPFNPTTTIAFDLVVGARARVEILDSRGRRVRTLLDAEALSAGSHTLAWDGRDDIGHTVASGVYIAEVSAGSQVAEEKLSLIK